MKKTDSTWPGSKAFRAISSITGKVLSAVVCLAICWLAGYPYFKGHLILHATAAALASSLFCWVLNGYLTRKRNLNRLEQFLWLLEYLGSRLAVGHTLENSLLKAASALETQMGSHRDLYKALSRLRKNLHSRLDLDRSLQQFSNQFKCADADKTMFLLSNLRIYGGRIETFIGSSRQMLQEQINIQKEVEAEQSQKYSEASVLSILPFCLAYVLILGNRQYNEALAYVNWAIPAQTVIFALAVIAAAMAIRIMSPETGADIRKRQFILRIRKNTVTKGKNLSGGKKGDTNDMTAAGDALLYKLATRIKPFYIRSLPWSLGIRFTRQLSYSYPFGQDAWICYLADKIKIGIYGMLTGLTLIIIKPGLWYLLPLFIIIPVVYQDRRLFEKCQMHKRQERLHFPSWLNTLSLLLGSGLTLQRALELSLSVWLRRGIKFLTGFPGRLESTAGNAAESFRVDLRMLDHQLESGMPAARALNYLSERSSVPQVQAALQLIIRYDSDGGNDLLQMVHMQTAACWQVQKNALRKKLETRSLLLHLPMGLDLAAVLSTAILPAIASLQNSY